MAWREQYDRMKRWHADVLEATIVDDRCADYFHAFFIACFHLKDWLKNDPTVPCHVGAAAEDLVNAVSASLALSADVANGSKHYRLDRQPRVDPKIRMERLFALTGDPATPSFGSRGTVVILSGEERGTCWDAYEVAADCVAEWEAFLRGHGLM